MIDLIIKQYNRKLLIYLSLLGVIGTVMLYSASWYESFISTNGYTEMYYLKNHLKRLIIGFIFLIGFLLVDYRKLKLFAPHLVVISLFLLILTKVVYLINGYSWYKPARWLSVGPLGFQTSDIARFSTIIFMAYYSDKKGKNLQDLQKGLLPAIFILFTIMSLIIIQPDYSTAIMIGSLGLIILFIGGAKLSQLSLTCSSALLIGIPVLLSREYRRQRVFHFLGLAIILILDIKPNSH